jgi:lysozyme family protein
MTKRFTDFFEWLMKWEGETYENVPGDPGGETKFGIDKASHPKEDIRNLTRKQAQAIYWDEYWNAVRANDLPVPLDWVVTDIAVNNGRVRAIKWLQEAIGVTADGQFGPKTKAALPVGKENVEKIRVALLSRRDAFYHEIARGSLKKFLKGWLNRNADLDRVTK